MLKGWGGKEKRRAGWKNVDRDEKVRCMKNRKGDDNIMLLKELKRIKI
jgi:hypothetical protein